MHETGDSHPAVPLTEPCLTESEPPYRDSRLLGLAQIIEVQPRDEVAEDRELLEFFLGRRGRLVAALGVGAERFKGYYDNADFGMKLKGLFGGKATSRAAMHDSMRR